MAEPFNETYKVQVYYDELGWCDAAVAGTTMADAVACLAVYDSHWPAQRHRVVMVHADGRRTVIQTPISQGTPPPPE